MNWPSDYCRPDVDTKLVFRFFTQVPENSGDQILKGVPSTENFRAAKSATSQERLEGLNQSTLHVRGKIVLNALRTCPRFQNIRATFLHPLKIEQRPIRISQLPQVWELGKPNLVRIVDVGDCTVRGPK